jgi:hypothetical protein
MKYHHHQNKKRSYSKYATKKRIPTIHKRSGFTGKSLRGIIGAPNGLYNQRFGQRQEQKFFDCQIFGANDNTGSQLTLINRVPNYTLVTLNGIAEGADYFNRVGRNITMKSIYINLLFRVQEDNNNENVASGAYTQPAGQQGVTNTQTQVGNAFIRVLVVYDLQTNAILPPASAILYPNYYNTNTGAQQQGSIDVTSFMNLDYRDRFKIILDKKFAMNAYGSSATYVLKKYKKLSTGVTYNSGIGGVGSINTGAVYILVLAQGSSYVYAFGKSRIRFTDA